MIVTLVLFSHASSDQPLEKLEVSHQLRTVTAASLVPASEPEQGHDFLAATATLGQLLPLRGLCIQVCFCDELFFSLDRLLHVHVLSTKAFHFAYPGQ